MYDSDNNLLSAQWRGKFMQVPCLTHPQVCVATSGGWNAASPQARHPPDMLYTNTLELNIGHVALTTPAAAGYKWVLVWVRDKYILWGSDTLTKKIMWIKHNSDHKRASKDSKPFNSV